MTDFNFLRIKWPKLAAIAADASRLVEVSPSSAISTMQNFCEWAADIALDLNDIKTQSGITQQEKIETLKAIGHAPTDVIGRFHNVMLAGGRRLYRQNEDVEEARMCIEDVYEIGRWLNKEADRSGWPPKSDYYRPIVSPLGMQGDNNNGYASGGVGETLKNYQPLILLAVGALVVIAVAAFLVVLALGGLGGNKQTNGGKATPPVVTPTPTLTGTSDLMTEPAGPTATPEPEVYKWLEELNLTSSQPETTFKGKWRFSDPLAFKIGDKNYENGLGFYITKSHVVSSQATMTISFVLDDDYKMLTFDLGAEAKFGYGAQYGKFRVQVYCDSTSVAPVYDSGLHDYAFSELGVQVNIEGCKKLYIKLTEVKGSKGTINVVMGAARLVKGGVAPADTSGSQPASGSAAASISPSPTPTSTGAGGGGGNADTVPPDESEQVLPPE